MKSLMLYPVVTMLLVIGLYIYWIFAAAYIASTGDDITNNAVMTSARVRPLASQCVAVVIVQVRIGRVYKVVWCWAFCLFQNYALSSNLLCAVNSTGSGNSSVVVSNSTCDSLLAATTFEPDTVKRYTLIYHLFGLLWTNQFIEVSRAFAAAVAPVQSLPTLSCIAASDSPPAEQGLGILIISGAISKWYFTLDKETQLPSLPCCSSTRRTCRYDPARSLCRFPHQPVRAFV
jgi:hypothetical protein